MSERLYSRLPAWIRIRDAEQGEPLRALLGILQEQSDRLEGDIAGLYDDWFIETAREWVVPYIGDLLGVRLLHTVEREGLYSQRAFVANTLGYRRRKGTLLVLEDLARDVTGWDARAVGFFEELGWTQNLNHLRVERSANPDAANPAVLNPPSATRVGTVDLRAMDAVDRIGTAFDETAHTVDVRRPPAGMLPPGWAGGAAGTAGAGAVLDPGVRPGRPWEGRYNIPNLGIFLWRLQSYPLRGVVPAASAAYDGGFHLSPLGNPAPLFTNPARDEESGHSSEREVSGPIRPMAFFRDPGAWYGHPGDRSVALYRGDRVDPAMLVPVESILCRDLSAWSPPPAGEVALDVRLGRVAFAPGEAPDEGLTAVIHHGFSADIGGGPYDRRATLERAEGPGTWEVTVARVAPEPLPEEWRTSVAAALADWDPSTHPRALITVADSATYDEELALSLEGAVQVTVQAANRQRPVLRLREGAALAPWRMEGGTGEEAGLTLDGVVVEGWLEVAARSLGRLELRHCTLVPGRRLGEDGEPLHPAAPSLVVEGDNPLLEVTLRSCITGALQIPAGITSLEARDTLVDRPPEPPPEGDPPDPGDPAPDPLPDPPRRLAIGAPDGPGPLTTLERVTVLGEVHVEVLEMASEVVFTGAVRAERRQQGCVRFSYVDDERSFTPRRFRCQPDLALETRRKSAGVAALAPAEAALIRSRMRPDFTSTRFGDPGYGQLALHTAPEVRTGSEDGAEMGVFESLKQPQRETNLRTRLDEYMPFGLEAGLIYVT